MHLQANEHARHTTKLLRGERCRVGHELLHGVWSECLGNSRMSLARLLHTILLLPAEIELRKELRRVKLRCNPEDPKRMNQLRPALERLSQLAIQDRDKRKIEFALV